MEIRKVFAYDVISTEAELFPQLFPQKLRKTISAVTTIKRVFHISTSTTSTTRY